jgi:hypothetical protein
VTFHKYDRARVLAIAQYDPILRAVVRAAARHPGRWVKHRSKKYAVRRLPGGDFELAAGVTMKQARRLAAKSAAIRKGRPTSSHASRKSARARGRASRKNDRPSQADWSKRKPPYEAHVHVRAPGKAIAELWRGRQRVWKSSVPTSFATAKRLANVALLGAVQRLRDAEAGNPCPEGRKNDPPPGRKALKVYRLPGGVGEIHVHASRPGPRRRWIVERWGRPSARFPKGDLLSTKTFPKSRAAFHAVKVMVANVRRRAKAGKRKNAGPVPRKSSKFIVAWSARFRATGDRMSGKFESTASRKKAAEHVRQYLERTGHDDVKLTVEKVAR